MRSVIAVILLTVLWTLLSGSLDFWTVFAGACFAALSWALRNHFIRGDNASRHRIHGLNVLRLMLAFVIALLSSAIAVAREAFRPTISIRPAFLRYPLKDDSDGAVTALASMISLTPGTLSLDVSEDQSELYIHALQVGDAPDAVREEIRRRLETPMNKAFPRSGS